jgi:zinc transporter 1
MEAIQRFVEPMTIGQPVMVLVVGTIGLLVNLIGLIMFRGHAHGHSHNDKESEGKHSHNHNMFGVFLHILGDFLGSIGVIISSVLLLIFDVEQHKWAKYVDPLVSVILATIILASTVPLVLNTIKILLQRVPDNIDLDQVCSQIEHLEGVLSVHELHIWHHSSNRVIGTLHVKLDTKHDFMTLAPRIQKILHSHGVHSTTIQPEYMNEDKEVKQCDLQCDVDGVYDAQDWQDTAVTVSTVPLLALEVND